MEIDFTFAFQLPSATMIFEIEILFISQSYFQNCHESKSLTKLNGGVSSKDFNLLLISLTSSCVYNDY
jgi:hypothetical protein